ncbi:helix-turn-helix transcriptional regulator [Priestia megaterium]|uniref:helix-turn-helix transcriptional regulator n=1 Tax=Priestia megaterium TaxID=1404 RepID=UPI002E23032F|nr:helix-turn-helix transcriptional regulator [Priestia megaterium]
METRIKELRTAKGMEQQELAKRVGCSYWWICHVENGKKKPSIDMLKRIAAALEVELKDIF